MSASIHMPPNGHASTGTPRVMGPAERMHAKGASSAKELGRAVGEQQMEYGTALGLLTQRMRKTLNRGPAIGPEAPDAAAQRAIGDDEIRRLADGYLRQHVPDAEAEDDPHADNDVGAADAEPPPSIGWLELCQKTDKGKPIPNLANVMLALRCNPDLVGLFAYDEMARTALLKGRIPGTTGGEGDALRPVRDTDVSALQEYLQLAGLERLARDVTNQAVDRRAEECRFHPVRNYLNGLVWDGVPRAERWLPYYLGAEHGPYTRGIGRMFLVAMVARVFRPGCKADYMLVLEGKQGARKSTVCGILGGEWFSDNLPELHGDAVRVSQHLRGKWLIEIAEMHAMGRAESEELKAFISRREEKFTPKYGRREEVESRQCVFIGTTNKSAYLRDETGGRRFWPVKVGEIDADALAHDRDQLLAEAVHLYRAGVQWWPTADFEAEHIQPQQEARYEVDAWEDTVAAYLRTVPRTTVMEVGTEALGLDRGKVGRAEQNRIVKILDRLKWAKGTRGPKGERFLYPPEPDAPP